MFRDASAKASTALLGDAPGVVSKGAALTVEVVTDISSVEAEQWDALAGDDNPFVEHAFLQALEESRCVGDDSGWLPLHLTLRDCSGALAGAMPLYLKTDSYGEYIFDWSWADAAMRGGIAYYPKLVSAVPFTPATGPRVLARDDDHELVAQALFRAAADLERRLGCSSTHVLFCSPEEQRLAAEGGFLSRVTTQFHWQNDGYESFDDFLATFRSQNRKAVRRERRKAREAGLRIEVLRGDELGDHQWESLYAFYRDTTTRKWGQPYLNRRFFELLRERLAERVVASLAHDGERCVAGALCMHKGAHLYGRYWGCVESYDMLHFELCYYRPIELCIARGWSRFDAGAQGGHKYHRGFRPVLTWSAHRLVSPELHDAVGRYLVHERAAVRAHCEQLRDERPCRSVRERT